MPRPCKDTENKTNINSRYGLRLVTQSRVIHYRSMFFSGPCVTPAGNKDQGKTQDRSLAKACRGEMELLKDVFRVKGRAASPILQRDKTAAPPTAR